MSDFPPLDPDFADAIFAEMSKMDVQLDPDPLQFGPKRLNQKTALARKYLSRLEAIYLDLSQQQARYKRRLRAATFLLEQHRKELFANNPHVRAGRAVSERIAIADGMLMEEVQEVANCQNAVDDLETVIDLVKVKRTDLKDVQGRLRDQLKICQEEMGLGARWGSKSPRGTELEPGQGYATAEDSQSAEDALFVVREVMQETMLPISSEPEEIAETEEDLEEQVRVAVSAPPAAKEPPFVLTPSTAPHGPVAVPADAQKQAEIDAFLAAPVIAQPSAHSSANPALSSLVDTEIDLDGILNSF